MQELVAELCNELEAVYDAVIKIGATETRKLNDTQGWNYPALSYAQLAEMAMNLSYELSQAAIEEISKEDASVLGDLVQSLRSLHANIIPNLTGNPSAAVYPYLATLQYATIVLAPFLSLIDVNSNRLPGPLARRLQKMDRDLNALMPDKAELEAKITAVRSAYEAAEALPTTLQELKSTEAEIKVISRSASESLGQIKTANSTALKLSGEVKECAVEAKRLSEQVSESYSIATSVGLAASFSERAKKLNESLYVWVGGLAVSLVVAMLVGYVRLGAMQEALSFTPFDAARVWIQFLLTVLGIGAPIWFAWMSTKQISQRFRLAEDYAYKASVSRAYEGYRREAVRIDPAFEKALFASALTRLDEAPLRLVEMGTHGSPLHEAANSSTVRRAVKTVSDILSRGKTSPEK